VAEKFPNTVRSPESPRVDEGFFGVRIAGSSTISVGARAWVLRGVFRARGEPREPLHPRLALVVNLPGGYLSAMPFRDVVPMEDDLHAVVGGRGGHFNFDVAGLLGDERVAGRYYLSVSLDSDISNVLEVNVEGDRAVPPPSSA